MRTGPQATRLRLVRVDSGRVEVRPRDIPHQRWSLVPTEGGRKLL